MSEIMINEQMKEDFESLFSIQKDKLLSLLAVLKTSKAGLPPQKLSENIHKDFGIEQEKLTGIIRLIFSVNQFKAPADVEKEKIVADFITSISKADIENFSPEKGKEFISEILKPNENILLTVQTARLSYDREKVLQDFNILTDIRPIFDGDEPKGFTVIHTLKLEYTEGDNEHVSYLAIDMNDINKLEKIIKSAKSRALSIKSNVSGKFVELEQD